MPAVLVAALHLQTDGAFVLSVLAIVPLAALLSHATEAVAARTGDTVGGLLNATLGNLTELVIALTALRAGEIMLVGVDRWAIVTATLFMLGASFLLGGLGITRRNSTGERAPRPDSSPGPIALLVPSTVGGVSDGMGGGFVATLSLCLAAILIATYCLGLPSR